MIRSNGPLYLTRDCFSSPAQWEASNRKFVADLAHERVRAEDFSIARQFAECFGAEAFTQLAMRQMAGFQSDAHWHEAGVAATSFPIITGEVINSRVIAAYTQRIEPYLQLVDVIPSNHRTERIVGFESLEGLEEVAENAPYKASGIKEKYVTVDNKKYGRTIAVTEEAVIEDQTGQLLRRASAFGDKAASKQQRLILEGVADINSTVYKPSGTAEALYAAARTTQGQDVANTTASAGTINSTNVDGALDRLYRMKDENGDYVVTGADTDGMILMCKSAVLSTARTLLESTVLPGAGNDVKNIYAGLAKPFINNFITASTTWLLGFFKRQFAWTEYFPIQTFQARSLDAQFDRDVLAAYKVRFAGEVCATDYRLVQEMTV